MRYLKLKRGRLLLMSFALFALLVAAFPGVDLAVARLFFDGQSFIRNEWWQNLLYDGVGYFLTASACATMAIYLFNLLTRRKVAGVDGRKLGHGGWRLLAGGGAGEAIAVCQPADGNAGVAKRGACAAEPVQVRFPGIGKLFADKDGV